MNNTITVAWKSKESARNFSVWRDWKTRALVFAIFALGGLCWCNTPKTIGQEWMVYGTLEEYESRRADRKNPGWIWSRNYEMWVPMGIKETYDAFCIPEYSAPWECPKKDVTKKRVQQ
jgi:hypothetical protein